VAQCPPRRRAEPMRRSTVLSDAGDFKRAAHERNSGAPAAALSRL
jgi:hypothetical protein